MRRGSPPPRNDRFAEVSVRINNHYFDVGANVVMLHHLDKGITSARAVAEVSPVVILALSAGRVGKGRVAVL